VTTDVCFGSQAAPFRYISLTAAFGGKADVLQLEISRHPQIRPRLSAFLNTGRQIVRNPSFPTSAFGQTRPHENLSVSINAAFHQVFLGWLERHLGMAKYDHATTLGVDS